MNTLSGFTEPTKTHWKYDGCQASGIPWRIQQFTGGSTTTMVVLKKISPLINDEEIEEQ